MALIHDVHETMPAVLPGLVLWEHWPPKFTRINCLFE